MRLIDADALKQQIKEAVKHLRNYQGVVICLNAINDAPTLEPKRGDGWIFQAFEHGYVWKCSACGGNSEARFAFCPFCGAQHWG